MSTEPPEALAIPAARSATTAASSAVAHCSVRRSPGSSWRLTGPTVAVSVANVASRMRSRGIRAVSFVGCGQLHYARVVQHPSRTEAARDPYAHGDGGRVILQVHGVRKSGGLGRERAAP